jgi:hypothetical protein
MGHTIETKTAQVDGHEVTFTILQDHDAKPTDYDCYSAEDKAAWARDKWTFVVVVARIPYGEAAVSGVEYGAFPACLIDMDRIIADHGDDLLSEILANKPRPVGGEPFGTKVTFWSANWGTRHAIITSSPKPEGDRERFDSTEWGIVIKGGGMTFVPGESLTLGWHPDAEDSR